MICDQMVLKTTSARCRCSFFLFHLSFFEVFSARLATPSFYFIASGHYIHRHRRYNITVKLKVSQSIRHLLHVSKSWVDCSLTVLFYCLQQKNIADGQIVRLQDYKSRRMILLRNTLCSLGFLFTFSFHLIWPTLVFHS